MKERLLPAIIVLGLVSGVQSAAMPSRSLDSLSNQVEGKAIANPEELAAYAAARATADPRMKAAALEVFARAYPNSVVKVEALEEAMAAYQQLGDRTQIERVGRLVLSVDAENLRALTAVIPLERARITAGNAAVQLLNQLRDHAVLGLAALPNWSKPAGLTDAEFARLTSQMSLLFSGAAGFGAFEARDYAAARSYYMTAVTLDPSHLENVYQLGIAQLKVQPLDATGFWYLARAAFLATTAGAGGARHRRSRRVRGVVPGHHVVDRGRH
jgi:tetratricopeptide (TPR) repeat protein